MPANNFDEIQVININDKKCQETIRRRKLVTKKYFTEYNLNKLSHLFQIKKFKKGKGHIKEKYENVVE